MIIFRFNKLNKKCKILLMKYLLAVFKGVLAGLAIGLGGFLFTTITYALPNQIGSILGALLFPIGLSIVCIFKLFLFTGKIGLVFEEKQTKDFYINLPLMYIGNIIGSLILGYICYAIFRNTDLFIRITAIAEGKINFDSGYEYYLMFIVKSLITGLCVYLAVKSYALIKNRIVGIFLIFVFIGLFVYIGGDHCIANMYYFSFANKWTGYAFLNIVLATICNSLGTIPGVLLFKGIKK